MVAGLRETGVDPSVDFRADALDEILRQLGIVFAAQMAVCRDRRGDLLAHLRIHSWAR